MSSAGVPSVFGLGSENGPVPIFWPLPQLRHLSVRLKGLSSVTSELWVRKPEHLKHAKPFKLYMIHMYMYVCMYIYICIYRYIRIHTCIQVCVCVYKVLPKRSPVPVCLFGPRSAGLRVPLPGLTPRDFVGHPAAGFQVKPYEPWSKLLIRGFYRDYIGSLLKGY